MEKDLRDAYAALKLLRADLVKTRRDKRALERTLSYLQQHEPPPSARQICASRETQQMIHEDTRAQVWRQATNHEVQVTKLKLQLLHNTCSKKERATNDEYDQQESEEVEKLALLNKLHSLTATIGQQMETMLAQKAAFALQKEELEARLEATQVKLQAEKCKVGDALLEQQVAIENYDYLKTQVEMLKQENEEMENEVGTMRTKLAAHAQTSSILKQQLEEKNKEQNKWKREQEDRVRKLQSEHAQETDAMTTGLRLKYREEHQHEIMELHQRCGMLELALSREQEQRCQDQEERRKDTMTLREYKHRCDELEAHVAALELKHSEAQVALTREQKSCETKLKKLESQLVQTQKCLVESERNVADVQSQLAAANAKLFAECKQYEKRLAEASQKLFDREQDDQRHARLLTEVEGELRNVQAKAAVSEATPLFNAKACERNHVDIVQLHAQHEKPAQVLAEDNEHCQHKLNDAQQSANLTSTEFRQCPSIMEQTTQDNGTSRPQQCEYLELPLRSAGDYQKPVHPNTQDQDSYALRAFQGLSDTDIAALPPSHSWALLHSGIHEIEEFLPQFQTLVAATSEMVHLCKSHAHTLQDRLEGNAINETPFIQIELVRLLRFTKEITTQRHHDEAGVTLDGVHALRKRVLDVLAQWHEGDACTSHQRGTGSMPTPTFTITSRETLLILQNWTSDRSKQLGVRRWLARMAAYPSVSPPLPGAVSNPVVKLPIEGCTLELNEMTVEVKDAFLLLLIPMLKQNRALHVRTFTRYIVDVGTLATESVSSDQDGTALKTYWAMRIHVQSATETQRVSRTVLLKASVSDPCGPPSPTSSISSSTSSSASSRRQLIQERLHYLHNTA